MTILSKFILCFYHLCSELQPSSVAIDADMKTFDEPMASPADATGSECCISAAEGASDSYDSDDNVPLICLKVGAFFC
jgi:hypothetical protein